MLVSQDACTDMPCVAGAYTDQSKHSGSHTKLQMSATETANITCAANDLNTCNHSIGGCPDDSIMRHDDVALMAYDVENIILHHDGNIIVADACGDSITCNGDKMNHDSNGIVANTCNGVSATLSVPENWTILSNNSSHSADTWDDRTGGDLLSCRKHFSEVAVADHHNSCSNKTELPFEDITTDVDLNPVLIRRINGGSFGEIFYAKERRTQEVMAVKLEYTSPMMQGQLLYEGNTYRQLENGPGIPRIHWFGMKTCEMNVMVMDLMGPNLYDLFMHCDRKFSLKTILLLADQMFETIHHVHSKGYVHRDLKPDNFVMGRGANFDKLYLIDFGLAKKYAQGPMLRRTSSYFRVKNPLCGTLRYTSINAHLGQDPSRRDDLESIGYTLLYLMKGCLPWQGLDIENSDEKLKLILDLKQNTSIEALCQGLPVEISSYMSYVRSLRLWDLPDYEQIRAMFQHLAKVNNIVYDNQYDWSVTSAPSSPKNSPSPTSSPKVSISQVNVQSPGHVVTDNVEDHPEI